MKHIEEEISALQNITPDQRALLRTYVGYCIEGRHEYLPEHGPNWINAHDYAAIRRAAIELSYKRRVGDEKWVAGRDKAFHEAQGATKSSVILPHKFL